MKESKHNTISALVFSILTIIGYLVTYSNKILFLLVFICERMYSFGAKEDLDNSLDNFILEDGKQGKKILGLIMFLVLCIVCIYLYSIFKYPYLLIILILGEILDYSIFRAYKKYKTKKD